MPTDPLPPPLPPFQPVVDPPPPWAGVVGRAINQLEERVEARLDLFHQELALVRALAPPQSPQDAPDAAQPPSAPAKGKAGKVVPVLGYAVILLGAASEIAASLKPGLVGPLQALLNLVKGLAQ